MEQENSKQTYFDGMEPIEIEPRVKEAHPEAPRQYIGEPQDEYEERLRRWHLERKKNSTAQKTLEEIFDQMEPGMRVMIRRESPDWAETHVETIEIDEDDELWEICGEEYLKNKWGGNRFRLQFYDPSIRKYIASKIVRVGNVPPRDNGVLMESPAERDARLRKMEMQQSMGATGSEMMQAMMNTMFNQMSQSAQENLKLIRETMQSTGQSPQNPMGQIQETLALLGALDKLRGSNGAATAEGGDEITGMVKDLIGTFGGVMAKQQQPSAPAAPRMPQMAAPMPSQQKNEKNIVQNTNCDDNSDGTVSLGDTDSLQNQIASMDNRNIALMLSETMDLVGPERGNLIMQEFASIADGGDDND